MYRHILLTISDDRSSFQAIRLLPLVFQNLNALQLTLLYIAPNPRASLSAQEIAHNQHTITQREHTHQKQARQALDLAQSLLQEHGFPQKNIQQKILLRQQNTAQDIIREGECGRYDAIALGRRGLSRLEEFFRNSVSTEVFSSPLSNPLWICRKQPVNGQGILLCIDDSAASMRCADHVGFMLRAETHQQITLAHFPRNTTKEAQPILEKGRALLQENGIAPERIHEYSEPTTDVARKILAVAKKLQVLCVASGCTGSGKSPRFFGMGSVSQELFTQLDFAGFWITQ